MKAKSIIGIIAGGVTAAVGLVTTLKGVKANKEDEFDSTLEPLGEEEATEIAEPEETPEEEEPETESEETE